MPEPLFKESCRPNPKACNFIKKETLTQVFSYEFCETSKSTFSTEQLRTTASGILIQTPRTGVVGISNLFNNIKLQKTVCNSQNSHRRCSMKNVFTKLTWKHLCRSLFIDRVTTLLKWRVQHSSTRLVFSRLLDLSGRLYSSEFCEIVKNTFF